MYPAAIPRAIAKQTHPFIVIINSIMYSFNKYSTRYAPVRMILSCEDTFTCFLKIGPYAVVKNEVMNVSNTPNVKVYHLSVETLYV